MSCVPFDFPSGGEFGMGPQQFLVPTICRDEQHQRELLARFRAEGLECQAKLC